MIVNTSISFEQQPQEVQEHISNFMNENPREESLSEKEFCGMRGEIEVYRYTKEIWVDGELKYAIEKTYKHPSNSAACMALKTHKILIYGS